MAVHVAPGPLRRMAGSAARTFELNSGASANELALCITRRRSKFITLAPGDRPISLALLAFLLS